MSTEYAKSACIKGHECLFLRSIRLDHQAIAQVQASWIPSGISPEIHIQFFSIVNIMLEMLKGLLWFFATENAYLYSARNRCSRGYR